MMSRLRRAGTLMTRMVGVTLAQDTATDQHVVDPQPVQRIQPVLRTVSRIERGLTRKSLSGSFEENGGLRFRTQVRYVFKDCPYIKIEVEFSAEDESVYGNPDDKVVNISRPYLEYPAAD